ncbi:hypothetical protein N7G274_008321 [Stereocaulon virgatum]|uniref:Uncharacterized protein n=1 Tax=Stereocaulon virgatum TaxID=373712 RepID=A0ABR4A114_9LECA
MCCVVARSWHKRLRYRIDAWRKTAALDKEFKGSGDVMVGIRLHNQKQDLVPSQAIDDLSTVGGLPTVPVFAALFTYRLPSLRQHLLSLASVQHPSPVHFRV